MIAKLTILPDKGRVCVTFRSGVQTWRKEYKSMTEATTETVELRVMMPDMKRIVDESSCMPGCADVGYAPETEVGVNTEELHTRGFLQGSWKLGAESRIA